MNYDELSSLCCDSDMEERLEDYFDKIGLRQVSTKEGAEERLLMSIKSLGADWIQDMDDDICSSDTSDYSEDDLDECLPEEQNLCLQTPKRKAIKVETESQVR